MRSWIAAALVAAALALPSKALAWGPRVYVEVGPARPAVVWVPGRWVWTYGGWAWFPGHWAGPHVYGYRHYRRW
jgi:hypothetical protein